MTTAGGSCDWLRADRTVEIYANSQRQRTLGHAVAWLVFESDMTAILDVFHFFPKVIYTAS